MPGLHVAQQCARATATSTGLDIGTLKSYRISGASVVCSPIKCVASLRLGKRFHVSKLT